MKFHSYKLNMTPYAYRNVNLSIREGLILEARYKKEKYFGEVAPFYPLSLFTLKKCLHPVKDLQGEFNFSNLCLEKKFFNLISDEEYQQIDNPHLIFAIEQILIQILVKQGIFDSFFPLSPIQSAQLIFPHLENPDVELKAKIAKIKVGKNIKNEIEWIKQFVQSNPDVKLRIDGNLQLNPQTLELFFPFSQHIDYFEDPLPDQKIYAIDEPLYTERIDPLKNTATHLIIRPSQLMYPSRIFQLLKENQGRKKFIFSSSFESDFTINFYLLLIHLCGLENETHGLDTLRFFSGSLLNTPLSGLSLDYQQETNLNERYLNPLAL